MNVRRFYQFGLHSGGTEVEYLGGMALDDDADALVFGKRVILDLVRKSPEQYAGWTMSITEGERPVGNLPSNLRSAKARLFQSEAARSPLSPSP